MIFAINRLFFKLSNNVGAFSIKFVLCLITGGITNTANAVTKIISKARIVATDQPLLKPRLLKNSTAGFNPIAKKIEMISNTKIWLAAASDLSNTNAVSAPVVARNPK